MKAAPIFLLMLTWAIPAAAQVDGYVSLMANVFPDIGEREGRQSVSELRARVFVERRQDVGARVRLNLSGYVDALLAARAAIGPPDRLRQGYGESAKALATADGGPYVDAIVRPADLYADIVTSRFDVRLGAARLVWGRLDEFQPTDVVNPIDLTRFLLEGRSEARLSVGLVRGRVFLPRGSTLETVFVPGFRASRFDQLDEATSPFNLAQLPGVLVRRLEPEFGPATFQGGARFTTTTARVDWGVSAYRGLRTFPALTLLQTFAPPTEVLETFPRFTMIGGDFETVRGPWGVRGEIAAFVDDGLQDRERIRMVDGRSIEGGIGADRRAGDYRVAGNVLWSWRSTDGGDLSLVLSADRSFARETRTVRVFAVYDPADATAFGRVIAAVSLRDDVWLEGSGGLFTGSAPDTLGQLTRRDFVYARLKIFL
jgi:hypothetical protein